MCPPTLSRFFFIDPPTTEISTLSLHDALPIFESSGGSGFIPFPPPLRNGRVGGASGPRESHLFTWRVRDRKSTRLNSSHRCISYAVFCLKKKKKTSNDTRSAATEHTKHGVINV